MLATVLKSPRATATTLAIIESFAHLRELSRNLNILSTETDEGKQKTLTQRSSELLHELLSVEEMEDTTETIFIVTADHGGIEKGHGGKTMQEMQTPFIISGKNIKKEGEFHESMMQYDVSSTIAHIFGLKQPQVWIGRPMLQVFK